MSDVSDKSDAQIDSPISMVIPTRDRAHTLKLVASSYFEQVGVDEIVFVNDGGTDETPQLIGAFAAIYQNVNVVLIRNPKRLGAAVSRNIGAAAVRNKLLLFCDDDEYLEAGYAAACREKLIVHNAGAVSGRRVYMREGETRGAALARFGNGFRDRPPYDRWLCELPPAAYFTGDVSVPFANSIIVTHTNLVRKFKFDQHYSKGNGYREESDYQMNLFVNGFENYMTNDVHSVHLPLSLARSGGSQTSSVKDLYWSIRYTNYFYKKYWSRYAARLNLNASRLSAILWFSLFKLYSQYIRQHLVKLAYYIIGLRIVARLSGIRNHKTPQTESDRPH